MEQPRHGRRSSAWFLIALLGIYAAASIVALAAWSTRGLYTVTGDEPHYLVMADGLVRYGSLEMTRPYAEEFASHSIYAPGLAPAGTAPQPPFAHVLPGPDGLFSWHGPGVSFLVAVPFALLGVPGAQLTMIALGALVVVVAWRMSAVFLADGWTRFLATLVVTIAYPLVPMAATVYPDMLAGLIALAGMYLLLTADRPRSRWVLAGYSLLAGFLPWLGMKFAPTAVLLVAAMAWSGFRRSRSVATASWLVVPAAVSLAILAIFNVQAFGRVTGPTTDGALEASSTSLMVLWGLLADQDQGILMQNPVLWIGLLGIGPLFARFRFVAVTWSLVVVSIWVPGALHTGWYGLGSPVGRYSWALAVLAIVPALLGLALVEQWSRRAFVIVVSAGVAVHAAFYGWTTFAGGSAPGSSQGVDLYGKSSQTWLESYAIFYFPAQDWFPALYDVNWAFGYWPNLAWLLLAIAVVVAGIRPRIGLWSVGVCLLLVLVAGAVAVPGPRSDTLAVGADSAGVAGYLSVGPVRQMRQGPYTWSVTYSAAAGPDAIVGRWEVVATDSDEVVTAGELPGTGGAVSTLPIAIDYQAFQPREFELRVAAYESGPVRVIETGVRHGSPDAR